VGSCQGALTVCRFNVAEIHGTGGEVSATSQNNSDVNVKHDRKSCWRVTTEKVIVLEAIRSKWEIVII